MEVPHLPPRLFLQNFTTSSISTTPSASSSPTIQSTSISSSLTSHSTTLTTSNTTSQSTSPTTSSNQTTPPPSSFSSSITPSTSTTSSSTTLSTTLSTSTSSSSPTPTLLPTPSPKPAPPSPTHKPNIALYTGIALSLLGLALLIYLLLRLETFLHRRRQHSKLLSSIPLNPHAGLRKLHLPQILHHRHQNTNKSNRTDKKGNRRSRQEHQDGRRFGVVGLGLDEAEEGTQVQSHEMGRRNREHFETWKRKRGFVDLMDERIQEEITGEENGGNEGRRRERRETFDAWKRGVVPPLRDEEAREEENVGRRQRQVVDVDAPTTGQGSAV